MKNKTNGISVVINTRNEELHISRCIKSVREFATEIVVIDMESTDKTILVAEKLGARIFRTKNVGYVEPARNFAISKASQDWIFLLDADEIVSDGLKKYLKKIAKNNLVAAVRIPRKNIIFKRWIKHTAWWPDYQIRFFKKNTVTWSNTIHSTPTVVGKILELPPKDNLSILHENIKTIDEFFQMMLRYTKKSHNFSMEQVKSVSDIRRYYEGEFRYRFFEERGYLDGLHGLFLSKLMEIYRFVEIIRSWEKKGFHSPLKEQNIRYEFINSEPLQVEIEQLKSELKKIKSAKFYKIWQGYCTIRDTLLGNKHA